MWRSVLLGVVLAGGLAGCSLGGGSGDSGAAGKTPGTISGLVVVEGGPPPLPGQSPSGVRRVKNAPIRITGETAAGARMVANLTSDGRGRFRIDLPTGRYTIIARIFRSAPTQPQVDSVVVNGGQTTRVRITGSLT